MAKRLEGKPFHIIASHCQNNPKEEVLAYLKQQELSPDAPNFTVTKFGRHPKVKGNGYVPYYMVFDHTGKLRRDHMCGAYHGGDGLQMIEWVDKLLKDAPALYVGPAPYEAVPQLAAQVGRKKNLPAVVKRIEATIEVAPEPGKTEMQRLLDWVRAYRDGKLQRADFLLKTSPSGVSAVLKDLAKELKGTALGEPVAARLAELNASGQLKQSIAAHKALAKIRKRVDKSDTPKSRASARKKLDALLEKHGDLPIAETIRAYRASLG